LKKFSELNHILFFDILYSEPYTVKNITFLQLDIIICIEPVCKKRTISDEQASKDYDDPLDYCKKHINRISLFVNGITNRIINEITRKFVGQVTYFYSKNNMELEKHLAFDS
jgi:hypothetical protein